MTGASSVVTVKDGALESPRIKQAISTKIEKGGLAKVNAIVVHQTGGSTAQSSLNSYKNGAAGAHFLIDKDGTIYQTAHINKMCWHVGNIQSRCYSLKTCSEDELKKINSILHKKGDSYALRVKTLSRHEAQKNYPERFPMNSDSIGIEIVSAFKGNTYETVTTEQNASLAWLVGVLQVALGLGSGDLFRHPEVSYKQASEAQSAAW